MTPTSDTAALRAALARAEAKLRKVAKAARDVLKADGACARDEDGCDRKWDHALAALADAVKDCKI